MSAANLFVRGNAAHLIADAAGFEPDGRIALLMSKIATCERIGMAIACNGAGSEDTPAIVERWLHAAEDQREALTKVHVLASLLEQINVRDLDEGSDQPTFVQLFIAAYADGKPAGYIVGSSTGTFGPSYKAGTLMRVSHVASPPVPDALAPDHGFLPVQHGRAVLNHQRGCRSERGDHRVGGWGELVTVGPSGITKERLCTWPDAIGAPINLSGEIRK